MRLVLWLTCLGASLVWITLATLALSQGDYGPAGGYFCGAVGTVWLTFVVASIEEHWL